MKLYSIVVFKILDTAQTPILLASAFDVSSFGFFKRTSVKEFMIFTSRTLAQNTKSNTQTKVQQNDYIVYSQYFPKNLVITIITDNEYNMRVAFDVMQKVFTYCYAKPFNVTKDNFTECDDILTILKTHQNPEEVDKILKIKKDIDQTKIIMYDALDKILDRGQKIDDLIQQSGDLNEQSKMFYKSSKKMNSSCCTIM